MSVPWSSAWLVRSPAVALAAGLLHRHQSQIACDLLAADSRLLWVSRAGFNQLLYRCNHHEQQISFGSLCPLEECELLRPRARVNHPFPAWKGLPRVARVRAAEKTAPEEDAVLHGCRAKRREVPEFPVQRSGPYSGLRYTPAPHPENAAPDRSPAELCLPVGSEGLGSPT